MVLETEVDLQISSKETFCVLVMFTFTFLHNKLSPIKKIIFGDF